MHPFTPHSLASPVDTVLGTITAQDPDTGSQIQYSILPETIKAKDQNGNYVSGDLPVNYEVCISQLMGSD